MASGLGRAVLAMARRQCRSEFQWEDYEDTAQSAAPPVVEQEERIKAEQIGTALFKLLTGLYGSGKLDANYCAEIAWYFSEVGGPCCETIAVRPDLAVKNGARQMKFALAKEENLSDIIKVEAPVYDKKTVSRIPYQIPVRLPTAIVAPKHRNSPDLPGEDPLVEEGTLDSPSLTEHIVYKQQKARVHWSKMIPIVLYYDGVGYTKRDSFHGVYMRDLRTMEEHIIFLIRALPLLEL